MKEKTIWEENYKEKRRYNTYPYDTVVSFVLKNYSNELKEGVKALDLGFGGGNHLKFLHDQGFDYYGIDSSETAKKIAQGLIGKDAHYSHIVTGDFTNMAFDNSFFDFVIDRQSIGHNDEKTVSEILQEVYRVLKKGGRYYGHVFSEEHPSFRYAQLQEGYDYSDFTDGAFVQSGMVHAFSLDSIMETYHMFKVIEVTKYTQEKCVNNKINLSSVIYEISAIK